MTAIAIAGGGKSYERALYRGERTLLVRIVAFGLVLAGSLDVLHRMDQVAVGDHRMVGCFLKFSGPVELGGAALVLRRVLQKLRGF